MQGMAASLLNSSASLHSRALARLQQCGVSCGLSLATTGRAREHFCGCILQASRVSLVVYVSNRVGRREAIASEYEC